MSTFEEIYRTYSEDVYRFSCWLCGDPIEAEDIVSETFVRLWGSRDSLQVATIKAYLLTIARNVYVSRRRRSNRYEPLSESPQDKSPSPDEEAETKDERFRYLHFLDRVFRRDRWSRGNFLRARNELLSICICERNQ